jgi:hypothetical protein
MLITPDPPPLTVNAPSADNVVVMVKSELPVPFVIVAPAEATVIAVEVRSVVDPKEIVVVPDADRIPKLWAVPSSVEAVALKVNDPASIVVALTWPDPAPRVMEIDAPDISWITAVSPLPKALVIDKAPPVLREEAVIDPLPPTFMVRLEEAVTLFKVISLYWSPVKLKAPVATTPVIETLPLPVPVPRLTVTPLASTVLIPIAPDPACDWVRLKLPPVPISPALKAPWS